MSAPWEVFVVIGPNEQHLAFSSEHDAVESAADAGDEWPYKPEVRYLRADLTCGECALNGKIVCPNDDSTLEQYAFADKISANRKDDDHPACMAFVPKEGP